MQDVYAQVEAAARSEAPVLIVGETGVGQGAGGARHPRARATARAGPSCRSTPAPCPRRMLESELFGHARGAFTGAVAEREGKLGQRLGRHAAPGRDRDHLRRGPRCSSCACSTTAWWSRWEATGRARSTSAWSARRTSTSRQRCAAGAIREDFYHRIMVLCIRVPPLRERRGGHPAARLPLPAAGGGQERHARSRRSRGDARRDDALPLAGERAGAEERGGAHGHHRPGRDARGASRRTCAPTRRGSSRCPAGAGRLRDEMEKVERAVIEAALRECRGEINATWQALGISRRALYERMKKYGLERESYR